MSKEKKLQQIDERLRLRELRENRLAQKETNNKEIKEQLDRIEQLLIKLIEQRG